jgi:hypothetical protein
MISYISGPPVNAKVAKKQIFADVDRTPFVSPIKKTQISFFLNKAQPSSPPHRPLYTAATAPPYSGEAGQATCPFQATTAQPLLAPPPPSPLLSPPPPSPCSLPSPPKIAAGELHHVIAVGVPDYSRRAWTPHRHGRRLDLVVVSSTAVRGACKVSSLSEKSGTTPQASPLHSRHDLDPAAPAALARLVPAHAAGGQLHPRRRGLAPSTPSGGQRSSSMRQEDVAVGVEDGGQLQRRWGEGRRSSSATLGRGGRAAASYDPVGPGVARWGRKHGRLFIFFRYLVF